MSQATAFPKLDDEQMEAVARIGDCVQLDDRTVVVRQGDKDFPFFVVKSGQLDIVERFGKDERFITSHGPGSFTGDVDMLTGRSCIVTMRAKGPTEVYRLCAHRLRQLLHACPLVSDMFLEAFQTRRKMLEASEFVGVRLIGEPQTKETNRLREFFYKNHVPYTFYEGDEARSELTKLKASDMPLPVVHCNGHTVSNPSLPKLAECIGISRKVDEELYDLIIVGAGPAGLAAAVYAASEALKTLVIDSVGPGGQAGSSSKIENFMGFPSGLSGGELANRGYLQALKFGATFTAPITVQSIEQVDGEHHLNLCTGQVARARSVLIASGVTYRQLGLDGCDRLEGAGVYYAATSVEARVCEGKTAIVVGGGNSAGQAAMFLASSAESVKLVIRGDDLSKSMSDYLCKRIMNHPRIELLCNSEVVKVDGNEHVEAVAIHNSKTDATTTIDCAALFIFIGAKPHTGWLAKEIELDDKGFIRTGVMIEADHDWPLDRPPCDLETTIPGILAAGDVRSGTTKRCGYAVGEGAMAVACIHRFLNNLR